MFNGPTFINVLFAQHSHAQFDCYAITSPHGPTHSRPIGLCIAIARNFDDPSATDGHLLIHGHFHNFWPRVLLLAFLDRLLFWFRGRRGLQWLLVVMNPWHHLYHRVRNACSCFNINSPVLWSRRSTIVYFTDSRFCLRRFISVLDFICTAVLATLHGTPLEAGGSGSPILIILT